MRIASALALFALAVISILASACAPAAAPAPTPAATKAQEVTKPTTEVSKPAAPAATSAAATKPAGTVSSSPAATAAAKPAASSDWKADWDKTVAAAKEEGRVVAAGAPDEAYHNAVLPFQTAYPDIKVEYTGLSGSQFSGKVFAERQAGQFMWDVEMGGSTSPMATLKPGGVLDPLKPILVLPEVLDDHNWLGGFMDGFTDKEQQYVYQFDGSVVYLAWVNRDMVPESELNSLDQLLDPKWKGKIVSMDPRINGAASTSSAAVIVTRGEDWLRKFWSQDVVIASEARQQAEMVLRGRYPIGVRLSPGEMAYLKQQGLIGNLKVVDPDATGSGALGVGYGVICLVNKAPHPNAAKVFINWVLSKEGQNAYVKIADANSRRLNLDFQGPADSAPDANVKYPNVGKEDNIQYIQRASAIAKEVIK